MCQGSVTNMRLEENNYEHENNLENIPGLDEFSHRLPHGGGISGPVQYQDPAIMSLSKMPPPQGE